MHHAKKAMPHSPQLVDFALRPVYSVLYLSVGHLRSFEKLLRELRVQNYCKRRNNEGLARTELVSDWYIFIIVFL